jgi:uncharacterized Zn-finger protein
MHRAAQKKTQKPVTKPVPKVTKARKVAKRTVTTKRPVQRARQASPMTAMTTFSTPPSTSSFTHQNNIANMNIVVPQAQFPIVMTPKRAFGGHSTYLPKEEPYNNVQTTKYGKEKLPDLFETDTPTFKKAFKTIDDTGDITGSRPSHQTITAAEYCEQFGIVLVDRDIAHCMGSTDGPHPAEFIQMRNSTPTIPQVCKYCGTRFLHKDAFDGSFVPFQPEH